MTTPALAQIRRKLAGFGIDCTINDPAAPRHNLFMSPQHAPDDTTEATEATEDHAQDHAQALRQLARLAAEHTANQAAQAAEVIDQAERAAAAQALTQAVQRLTDAAVPGAPLTYALIRMALPAGADEAVNHALLSAGWQKGRIDRDAFRARVWRAPQSSNQVSHQTALPKTKP